MLNLWKTNVLHTNKMFSVRIFIKRNILSKVLFTLWGVQSKSPTIATLFAH